MELGKIKPADGSTKKTKRIGRGQGSGWGKTAARGHNGQKSRSGSKRLARFEGGQMPLQRRLPKFGFTNLFRNRYQTINVNLLGMLAEKYKYTEITPEILKEHGVIRSTDRLIKILGRGELKAAITVHAHACSQSAKEKIEKAGGKINQL